MWFRCPLLCIVGFCCRCLCVFLLLGVVCSCDLYVRRCALSVFVVVDCVGLLLYVCCLSCC